MRLSNKIAVVLGAASGIGRATALLFGQEGAQVVIGDINDAEGEVTTRQLREIGVTALFTHCDVRSAVDVEHLMLTTVEAFGRIDVLHNSVGIDIKARLHETTEANWADCLDVNLGGVFRAMKYALPHMLRQRSGSVINIASVNGLVGLPGWAAYAASKGGIIQLTRQAAIDYAADSIRVNAICPGTVRTPMTEKSLRQAADAEALLHTWELWHPLGRIGEPVDIAYAALYLASDESSWVTGQLLIVDGGFTVRGDTP